MIEFFGRLAPGATLEQARAELDTAYAAMIREQREAYPEQAHFKISAVKLRDQIASKARTILLVLMGASALVFVIAISNVANLILARSVRRDSELAIRAALGASNAALRRTLLAESLIRCAGIRGRGSGQPVNEAALICGTLVAAFAPWFNGREPIGRNGILQWDFPERLSTWPPRKRR